MIMRVLMRALKMSHNTVATIGSIAFIAICALAGWTAGGRAFKHQAYSTSVAHYGN